MGCEEMRYISSQLFLCIIKKDDSRDMMTQHVGLIGQKTFYKTAITIEISMVIAV